MAVAAVAAAVNRAAFGRFGYLESPGFIVVERPQVVFFVKMRFAPGGLIVPKLFIARRQQCPVAGRRNPRILFLAGGAIAGEGVHAGLMFHRHVDQRRNLVDVHAGYGGHNHAANPRFVDAGDLFQGNIVAARLAEPIVRLSQAVQRKLVLLAAAFPQAAADPVV